MKIFKDMYEGSMIYSGLSIGYIRQWTGGFPMEYYISIKFRIYKWEILALVAAPTKAWKAKGESLEYRGKVRAWGRVWRFNSLEG
jgi:hypothetical protein